MILPGGHAKSVKQYLEDKALQRFVADFFDHVDNSGKHKPVAAICHGVVHTFAREFVGRLND